MYVCMYVFMYLFIFGLKNWAKFKSFALSPYFKPFES